MKWGKVAGLMGEYRHTLDEKGRLTLPARLRDELGQPFVATRGLDRCLFFYPQAEWEQMEAKLRALPMTQPDARAFVRLFFAGAAECRWDGQGRVLLPQNLREYAGLAKETVVIGCASRAEVWAQDEWERYAAAADASFAAIAERIGGL